MNSPHLELNRPKGSALRDDKGRLLPGSVLNPGGRIAGVRGQVEAISKKYGGMDKVFEYLFELAIGKASAIAKPVDRMHAAELLLAYRYGRPSPAPATDEAPPKRPPLSGVPLAKLLEAREQLLPLMPGPAVQP